MNEAMALEGRTLLVEPCDFEGFPVGGQLSFARQLMQTLGQKLALVGWRTDDGRVGIWEMRDFSAGGRLPFYAIARHRPTSTQPLVPRRITAYCDLLRHSRRIAASGARNLFTQSPESYIALSNQTWASSCYMFPGVENPLGTARYRWGRPFAHAYERRLFSALKKADVVLACADKRSIRSLAGRSSGILAAERIVEFPTRVDTAVFSPTRNPEEPLPPLTNEGHPLLVACGRLSEAKGWSLLLASVAIVLRERSRARLIFVGDGEDRARLERRARSLGISDSIHITGFVPPRVVAAYLRSADLALVGSYVEGWSVAILEALACGTPVVSTDVSGARDLIVPGATGSVVEGRDPTEFAGAILAALRASWDRSACVSMGARYSVDGLAAAFCKVWPAVRNH